MFSKDFSFQAVLVSSPGKLREACASRGLDQPGVLAACVEDVPADMEQAALPTDVGVGTYRIYRYSYRLFCFLFARIFLFSPASSLLSASGVFDFGCLVCV